MVSQRYTRSLYGNLPLPGGVAAGEADQTVVDRRVLGYGDLGAECLAGTSELWLEGAARPLQRGLCELWIELRRLARGARDVPGVHRHVRQLLAGRPARRQLAHLQLECAFQSSLAPGVEQ